MSNEITGVVVLSLMFSVVIMTLVMVHIDIKESNGN